MPIVLFCPFWVDAAGTFLFIPGENSRQLQEWSQFRVCREHQAWPAIILAFYFVSEPIGFEKYILYRCRRQNHFHYSARQRLISHRAAIPPLTGAKAAGRNAGQNAGCRNAAVERTNRCQTQHQLHGNGGVRHDVGIAAVQHQGKSGRWSPLTEKGAYLSMTVNRNTDRRFPHSKLAKLLHYNGSDLNSIGRRTGVCLFDYGMTPQEWRSSQHGKSG